MDRSCITNSAIFQKNKYYYILNNVGIQTVDGSHRLWKNEETNSYRFGTT